MANTKVATITFHGQQLITAKIDNDVFVAMKPVVSGIGVSWQGQHEKLKSNPARWGVKEILIPSDGGEQSMICLPLRKLHGWLMTIHPGKIKDQEVRENVIVYQNECDDVLWKYYSEGVAINPRLPITPEQQSALQAIVATISPDGKQRGMIWARFNRHFKIAKYNQLPVSQIDEAKQYLIDTFLEGEYIEQAELDMQAYVAAHQVSIVDIKAQLKLGLSEPTLPLTDKLRKAIHTKSFEITGDCYHAITDHLERRIAFNCEVGSPRYLDEQRALKLVENTTLDSALTHHYYGLLENIHSMAQSLTMMTEAYKRDVGKALGKPQLLAA